MRNYLTNKKIIILGTGGTIAGTAADPADGINYHSSQLSVEQLLPDNIVAAAKAQQIQLVCEQVAQVDSKDMTFAIWQKLLQRCLFWLAQAEVSAIVITHGTDTVEETSFFLHQALPGLTKPIVFTCAMRPANAIDADGPENLFDAITVAAAATTAAVMLVCAGQIHHAKYVQKVSASALDAFSSQPEQLIGNLQQQQINWQPDFSYPATPLASSIKQQLVQLKTEKWPKVEILYSYSMSSVAPIAGWLTQGVSGIIVAATGNGTLHDALLQQLFIANEQGMIIWLNTRCAFGGLIATHNLPFPTSHGLIPSKARIALLLELIAKLEIATV